MSKLKLLYGVQGTGNGHITRARALSRYFEMFGVDVEYLFSGRQRNAYFDMEPFGPHFYAKQGLTFSYEAGSVRYLRTLRHNSFKQLIQDIRQLDLSTYDAVVTDFEPISAWAAKLQGLPCIGIGHQYAFLHAVPTAGDNWFASSIMRNFAPCNYSLGLHWHHFNQPILPPITEPQVGAAAEKGKILVYFGFEEPEDVIDYLKPFRSHTFVVYGRFESFQSLGHIQLKPLSRTGFCKDLATSEGVICNAGFELASEAIQSGKKLLVKPLKGQMEQLSNALALEQLGLGMSMAQLDSHILKYWLEHFKGKPVQYPNVAKEIVSWLANKQWANRQDLVDRLWHHSQGVDCAAPTLVDGGKIANIA